VSCDYIAIVMHNDLDIGGRIGGRSVHCDVD
jgi:hypothetical protein